MHLVFDRVANVSDTLLAWSSVRFKSCCSLSLSTLHLAAFGGCIVVRDSPLAWLCTCFNPCSTGVLWPEHHVPHESGSLLASPPTGSHHIRGLCSVRPDESACASVHGHTRVPLHSAGGNQDREQPASEDRRERWLHHYGNPSRPSLRGLLPVALVAPMLSLAHSRVYVFTVVRVFASPGSVWKPVAGSRHRQAARLEHHAVLPVLRVRHQLVERLEGLGVCSGHAHGLHGTPVAFSRHSIHFTIRSHAHLPIKVLHASFHARHRCRVLVAS
jgi:hypothetical protein